MKRWLMRGSFVLLLVGGFMCQYQIPLWGLVLFAALLLLIGAMEVSGERK